MVDLRKLRIGTALFTVLAVACGSDTESRPEGNARGDAPAVDPFLHEQRKYFEGLEEWVLIHKGSDGEYCVRVDGREQDCEAVKAEDRRVAYEKWGAMTKPFGQKVMGSPTETVFEASVLLNVPSPEGLRSNDRSVREQARKSFTEAINAAWPKWQSWIVAEGGTILRPVTQTMPMFGIRATGALFRSMAWNPEVSRISEKP